MKGTWWIARWRVKRRGQGGGPVGDPAGDDLVLTCLQQTICHEQTSLLTTLPRKWH